ncbi:LIVCS family branched-chain amino acid:cation transporter [Orbus hercynius]|uniref:Branched-chain amino acid transport system carrier protein n=1 Tax=Orbus hercynius TaxID=593135 RepID=A0A495RKY2_9GAMM|nr:branched-chain amino acid transport system II carrier protein [Orbus hercynius]RKS87448.1 LIVCS family branched-chain amino acid:cation transporter [Orbus hercynius]
MRIIFIGITLFALFFGAGNLIFPVSIGQLSGDHFGLASLGFVVTGVVFPLLGVMAMGFSGEKDFLKIAQRCGVIFGLVFATTLYLTIGPLFAMPRTGSISYEIAIKPFVDQDNNSLYLALFTFLFYGICCLLSLNPHKFIDIVGKILTPLKISFILILILAALIAPMGHELPAVTQNYQDYPFFTGFTYGYLTMDTLASLIFGIIVVQSVISYGLKDKKKIMFACFKASLIAGAILAFLYVSLVYMGATSVEKLGILDNGGAILAKVSTYYFGVWGNLILGLMVTIACMTTNIGLTHACANYLLSLYPKLSYRQYAIIFSIVSGLFANVGLSALISFSVPVLSIIYPVTIVLIFLTFAHRLFDGNKLVYIGALYLTLLTSILFEIAAVVKSHSQLSDLHWLSATIECLDNLFANYLPLYTEGIGWLIPAIVGGLLGYIGAKLMPQKCCTSN